MQCNGYFTKAVINNSWVSLASEDPLTCFNVVCLFNSTDGILLKEVNRLLRSGGYFVYSAPPAYRKDKDFPAIWDKLVNLTTAMCWKLISRKVQTAIWIKENNLSCLLNNARQNLINVCDVNDDSKPSWNIPLRHCVDVPNSETDSHKLPPRPERLSVFSESLSKLGLPVVFYTSARSSILFVFIYYQIIKLCFAITCTIKIYTLRFLVFEIQGLMILLL